MIHATVSDDYQIIQITVTGTPTNLRQLITDDLCQGDIIQVGITPDSDILIQDARVGTDMTLAGGETKIIPARRILDHLLLTATGTVDVDCAVELYYILK